MVSESMKTNRSIAIDMLQERIMPTFGYIAMKYLEILMVSENDVERKAALKLAIECVKEQEAKGECNEEPSQSQS